MHVVQDTIDLTDIEKELLGTLFKAAQQSGKGTVLRCAGGWVRDKLLGRESLDIDVALDNIMGKDFADLVNAHLQSEVSMLCCYGIPYFGSLAWYVHSGYIF